MCYVCSMSVACGILHEKWLCCALLLPCGKHHCNLYLLFLGCRAIYLYYVSTFISLRNILSCLQWFPCFYSVLDIRTLCLYFISHNLCNKTLTRKNIYIAGAAHALFFWWVNLDNIMWNKIAKVHFIIVTARVPASVKQSLLLRIFLV